MDILYLLIAVSLLLVLLIMAALWWSIQSGQYDDLEWPAHSILMDDDAPPRPTAPDQSQPSPQPPPDPDQPAC